MTELPVGEECWIYPAEPVKPVSCPLGLPTQPLELAARPADDIEIDPFQGWTQLRLVEVAVVVDPAANARVVHLGHILQGLVAAMMKRPAPNCSADVRDRRGSADLREEEQRQGSASRRCPAHGAAATDDERNHLTPKVPIQVQSVLSAPSRPFLPNRSVEIVCRDAALKTLCIMCL